MDRSTTYTCQSCGKQGIKKAHSKKNKYCSIKCQNNYQRKLIVEDWLAGGVKASWRFSIPRWAKEYLIEQRGYKCEICAISDWRGQELVLECDHIDGNPHNNSPKNLQLVCPNCHSQSATYKNRNRGSGRQSRQKTLQ